MKACVRWNTMPATKLTTLKAPLAPMLIKPKNIGVTSGSTCG